MNYSRGATECEQGHRVAGDNVYMQREAGRIVPRCRSCSGAQPTTIEKRARAAELARARRARLKEADPEKHAAARVRENALRTARESRLAPELLEEILAVRDKRKRANAKAMRLLNVTSEQYNSIEEEKTLSEVELARNQDRPSAAWNMLKVKGDALPAWDEFSRYLEITPTPCQESTDWIEFDDPRPGREDENTGKAMPTKSVAAMMCQQCPLIDLCQNFAKKDKPDFGIWGGERWVGGKRLT